MEKYICPGSSSGDCDNRKSTVKMRRVKEKYISPSHIASIMTANSITPLINGDSQSQNEKSTARLSTTWRSALAVFGAAMLMYITLSSSSSSTSTSKYSSSRNSGALTVRSNVSIQATTPARSATTTTTTTAIDSNNLSISDGNNNDPNSVGPSSVSLRAAAAIVSSGEGTMGSCRTTGSAIPYNGGHQTFGEPLSNLDFQAPSYATRSWQDKEPTKFNEAWQGCAKQCNYEQRCHTYTVYLYSAQHFGDQSACYLHDPYKARYNLDIPSKGYESNHVSGVCRLNNK